MMCQFAERRSIPTYMAWLTAALAKFPTRVIKAMEQRAVS
jgi:hypothetical protein